MQRDIKQKMIYYIIIALIGLIIGLILARFTKEELKSGKNYFIWFKKIILIVLIATLIYLALPNYLWIIISFIVGILLAYFFKKEYFYLVLALFLSLYNPAFLFIVILIFLFGLPYGTLMFTKKYKYKAILFDLILFAIPFLLFFIKDFVSSYNHIFLAFAGGALFTLIFKK